MGRDTSRPGAFKTRPKRIRYRFKKLSSFKDLDVQKIETPPLNEKWGLGTGHKPSGMVEDAGRENNQSAAWPYHHSGEEGYSFWFSSVSDPTSPIYSKVSMRLAPVFSPYPPQTWLDRLSPVG